MSMARQSRPTVLLTRPAEASERFAAELRARFGPVDVVVSPLMVPEFRAPVLPDAWDGVILTSETGARALARLTARRGPAICVGPRTAEVAQALGWQAEAVGGDAESLVAALAARGLAGRWLHARGQDAAGDLAARLNAAGADIAEAVVYAQVAQPLSAAAQAALAGAAPVVAAVFSPRSARLLAAEAGALLRAPLAVAAISAAAAAPVQALAGAGLAVAPTPDAAGMLAALGRVLGKDGGAAAAQVYS
ncbi:MAG: uroporphyrinogen-III synthase [Gemmobacter sp.]|uniref:uroporphyrinogen-III synthase n=1 Tax=Gemmobacter sp. TaxID=1898957 RepID=UPI00391DF4BF